MKDTLRHIAIIMDGNGRWAEKQGKSRTLGHRLGLQTAKKIISFSSKSHFKILTLYAFSIENWKRPKIEVQALMKLFLYALRSESYNLHKDNIRLNFIGNILCLNKKLIKAIQEIEKLTLYNTGLIVNIAANYTGTWDIIEGIKKIIRKVKKGILKIEQIEENTLSKNLSTSTLIPVDLVIRTGGEKRLSNFLLWQIAYAELYFTDILWPDFDILDFQHAISFFLSRKRRFGGLEKILKIF